MKKAFLMFGMIWSFCSFAEARDVMLPARAFRVCIGKPVSIMQTKIQLHDMSVNGRTSPNSTFWIKGESATLQCDLDERNSLVVQCKRPGVERYNVDFMFNFEDPNRYHVQLTVMCVRC